MHYIGERLRAMREASGLSQRELAQQARLHAALISHLEQNRRPVTMNHAVKLAKVFGVSLDDLLANSEVREIA